MSSKRRPDTLGYILREKRLRNRAIHKRVYEWFQEVTKPLEAPYVLSVEPSIPDDLRNNLDYVLLFAKNEGLEFYFDATHHQTCTYSENKMYTCGNKHCTIKCSIYIDEYN